MTNDKVTQELRVLQALQDAKGAYVNGRYFLHTLMLSQFHRAIFNLQHKRDRYDYEGTIEVSSFRDEYGFCSYRLWTGSRQIPAQEIKLEQVAPAQLFPAPKAFWEK